MTSFDDIEKCQVVGVYRDDQYYQNREHHSLGYIDKCPVLVMKTNTSLGYIEECPLEIWPVLAIKINAQSW